ncbi:MAG: thiol peroxidase [Bacteroidota bacterium]|nr:thiol peroxidase [Bacteroidota bacterium]
MAKITLKGNPINTTGELPTIGSKAPDFTLTKNDLSNVSLNDYKGNNVILNIFPSIDTGVCATSVREFNQKASELKNTKILCISKDLPFAQSRFCGAEGIENVVTLSDFQTNQFAQNYGVLINEGALKGLHSRAVVVIDSEGYIKYTEQVPEITQEPNYQKALDALK